MDAVLSLHAVEFGAYPAIKEFRQRILAVGVHHFAFLVAVAAAGEQADVVGEVAVEHPDTALVHAIVEAQGEVAGDRLFLVRVGIAHFEGAGRRVRAVGIQLVEGRRTLGIAEGGGQRPYRRQPVHRATGQAAGGEAARAVVLGEALVALGVRIDLAVLQATTETQVQTLAGFPFFEDEQGRAVGFGMWHEGFLAEGGETAVADLRADHALQRAERAMTGFDAALIAVVLERGAGFAALEFLVLVLGVGRIELQRGEGAVQIADFRGEGVAVLMHLQADLILGGRAVVAVIAAIGKPGIAMLPVIAAADGAVVLAAVAVGHAVFAGISIYLPLTGGVGVAGDAQVVEFAGAGIQVQGEAAIAGLQRARGAARGVGAAIAQLAASVQAVHRLAGDAVVEAVDHTADGIAAIEQSGRAAHDFHALDGIRVFRHGVVVGQRRSIQRTHAIAQDADTVAIHAADDRPAGAGAEPGRGHARQAVEGLAQAALLAQRQFVALQDAAGSGRRVAAQRVAGDDLRRQFARPVVGGKGRQAAEQHQGQRRESPLRAVEEG
ncbi:hypothetical protein D3C78_850560 [compost metagenome]